MKRIFKKIFSIAFSVFFVNLASFPVHCSGGAKKIYEEKKPYKAGFSECLNFPVPRFVWQSRSENYSIISENMYQSFLAVERNKFKSRDDTLWIGPGIKGFKMSDINSLGTDFKRIIFESGSVGLQSFRNILYGLNINEEETVWKKEIFPLTLENGQVVIKDGFKLVITNNTDGNQLVFYFKFGDTSTMKSKVDYNFNLDVKRYNGYVKIVLNLNPENPLKMKLENKEWYYINHAIVPEEAKNIKENSFSDKRCLEIIDVLSDISSIGESSFRGCINLKEIHFHGKVEAVDSNAFKNCGFLREIFFPDGLKFIGDCAFENCCNLERIVIPLSTEIIYKNAFIFTPDNLKIVYNGVEYDKNTFLNFSFFDIGVYIID